MRYPTNIGCLWLALLLFLIGGTPLLAGVLRVFGTFFLVVLFGAFGLTWWLRRQAVLRYARAADRGSQPVRRGAGRAACPPRRGRRPINRGEVGAIRKFFQQSLGYQASDCSGCATSSRPAGAARSLSRRCAREFARGYGFQERFIVIQVLARVAEADGRLGREEMAFIERVAGEIGLRPFYRLSGASSAARQARRDAPPRRSSVEDALAVLGLAVNATSTDIKSAWRKLSLENHPDRVTHLGGEFRALAEERMRGINEAYTRLKQAGRVE